jgi:hypothetical protein
MGTDPFNGFISSIKEPLLSQGLLGDLKHKSRWTDAAPLRTLPLTCQPFEMKPGSFPTIEEFALENYQMMEAERKARGINEESEDEGEVVMGDKGGHWNACTHLNVYGINFMPFFARMLSHGFRPKSVLEFGCGLGTTSDFVARFTAGGSDVVHHYIFQCVPGLFSHDPAPPPPPQYIYTLGLHRTQSDARGGLRHGSRPAACAPTSYEHFRPGK